MNVQKTLLRFLQEQEFHRLGDPVPVKVDVRIISATNSDLKDEIKSGTFREDLYYRLNVVNLHLPPLRERRDDIPLLIAHFVAQQNAKFGTKCKGFDSHAMDAARNFDWHGNIRQLKNAVEACMALESGDQITFRTLSQILGISPKPQVIQSETASELSDDSEYSQALARFETDYIQSLLRKNNGNVEAAAKEAGMNMATIYRKMKRYCISRESYLKNG